MGFFKDLRKLSTVSKEVSAGFDPAAQMRQASAQMQQSAKQAHLVTAGAHARATVTAVRDTRTEVNLQPISEVDVTVFPTGVPPFPATASVVGHVALAGLSVGAQVEVRYDPAEPSTVAIAGPLGA